MELYSIFPKEQVLDYFKGNVVFNNYEIKDIDEIIKNKSTSVFQVGARSWDRYVHMNNYKKPRLLMQHFINENPLLYKEVERVIGEECLSDISYVNAVVNDPELPNPMSAELLVATIYPGELHIVDIQLIDPYQPIKPQKYVLQPYKGLGMLNIVIDNCIKYCLKNNIRLLTLVAATKELISVFERHGFKVEDSPSAKIGMQYNMSIPMVLEIAKG